MRARPPTTSRRLFPPAPSELTTLITQTNTLQGLSSIVQRHSSGGEYKDLPLGPYHLTALYRKIAWITRDRSNGYVDGPSLLPSLLDELGSKLFQNITKMDMRGVSSIVWSMGKIGCNMDPILLEGILSHMNCLVDISVSPPSTSYPPSSSSPTDVDHDPWLRGSGQSSSSSPSSSSSAQPLRRLTNAPDKKVTIPRVSTSTADELTDLCTGFSWLATVNMRGSSREWKPLMNAISRQARLGLFEPRQLSDVLYSLRVCGMQCESHHLEDLAARAVKSLPQLTPIALIQKSRQKQQSDDEIKIEIGQMIYRSTSAVANICLGLLELGLERPGKRLCDAASSAIDQCLLALLSLSRGQPRDEIMRQISMQISDLNQGRDEATAEESFPLSRVDDSDLLPPPTTVTAAADARPITTDHEADVDLSFQKGPVIALQLTPQMRRTVKGLSHVLSSWGLSDQGRKTAHEILL